MNSADQPPSGNGQRRPPAPPETSPSPQRSAAASPQSPQLPVQNPKALKPELLRPASSSAPQASPAAPSPRPQPAATSGRLGAANGSPPQEKPNGAAVQDSRPIAQRSPRAALQPEKVPLPARRARPRNPILMAANVSLTLLFLLAVVGGTIFAIGKQRFEQPGPLAADKVVDIPRGGIRDTAELLEREGVIERPYLFIAGALLLKAQRDLKSGEYRFARNASLHDVVETILEGKVVQHALTLAEGLTSDQIVQRLMDNPVLTGDIREYPREGTLLPETYRFTRGTTRMQIIRRMQQEQRRVVQEVWEHRSPDLPLKTPEQLVTLASIVEKETGKPEERTRVAAVFINRLQKRMKLQSDPTIIYGLVGGKGTLGRPILKSEIEHPNPYNTYLIEGLPPGPIANPGRASLEAAANPARTKELYFVADGTGGHLFSESYEVHQKNVARLRVMEQQAAQPHAPKPNAAR